MVRLDAFPHARLRSLRFGVLQQVRALGGGIHWGGGRWRLSDRVGGVARTGGGRGWGEVESFEIVGDDGGVLGRDDGGLSDTGGFDLEVMGMSSESAAGAR